MYATICKGITLSGKPCHRKIKRELYCHQHRGKLGFRQAKPKECIICYNSLANQKRALGCGHWIHKRCVVESAKAECPVCRSPLNLGFYATRYIKKLAQKREQELLLEEEEELRSELENQVTVIIAPALQERIHDVIGDILENTNDIDTTDVIMNIFNEDSYQYFLYDLIDPDFSESDIDSSY